MQEFDQKPAESVVLKSRDIGSKTLSELNQIIQAGRIPNALLFTGPAGTGKNEAAFEFAKTCNCRAVSDLPCNTCLSCKKITAGMHPDIIILGLADKKKIISISQIREMGRQISARPNEADHRMVLIQDADKMNIQAQNALLKVLEEPPENTFFILSAKGLAPLLPTILSRCRQFKFSPLSPEEVQHILSADYGVNQKQAYITVQTVGTDLNRALKCLNIPVNSSVSSSVSVDWQKQRIWFITELTALVGSHIHGRSLKALALSQTLSRDPEGVSDILAIARTVLRDFCVFKYSPEKIVNLDFFDTFKDISQIHVYSTFLEWMKDLYETEKRLVSNSSLRLTLDRFFLKLSSPKELK